MRVALIHDWLTGLRGGEKVLEVLCELYPEATLFTLVHIQQSTNPTIESLPLRTAFTQRLPGVSKYYRWYLPLYPWAIESLDFSDYDLLISSSHCVAKGAIPSAKAVHICYCHTPMRYIWDRFADYFGKGLKSKFIYGPFAYFLRKWDVASSDRVHHFIANSEYVAKRIKNYYGRETDAVIHPPVDTDFFAPSNDEPESYYLIVSALAPYKRLDVAIDCFNQRSESLIIVGTGPEEAKLRARAGKTVTFLGHVDDEELRRLYQRAQATLLPGVEDFGIVPLESQACGRPVIVLGEGGATETVKDGQTGVLFDEPSPRALSSAIDKISSLRLNKSDSRDWACRFSRERFKSSIKDFIESKSDKDRMKSQ
jgi:glycosyltransferase involved in cell wall biosynthesis